MKHLRILHFLTDDKFLDTVIRNHDSIRKDVINYYVLTLKSGENKEDYKFQYIKDHNRVVLLYTDEIIGFVNQNLINAIIIHSLLSAPIEVIPEIKNNIPILWVAWGYDIYQLPINKPFIEVPYIYSPLTERYYMKFLKRKRGNLKNTLASIRDYLEKIGIYQTKQTSKLHKTLKRINFFSGIIDMEYQLMRKNKFFQAKESVYVYSPLEYSGVFSYPKGNNILLGNSGNFTNNHLDILNLLRSRNINENKIIMPLNYGGEENYVSTVVSYGKKYFNTKYEPLTEFIEYGKYSELINSCSSVIIGTLRQQAMGNISLAFEKGAKVFLYKNSILYQYFKNKGFIVYTIEDDLTKAAVASPLSESEANYNFQLHKDLISNRWNIKAIERIYTQFEDYIAKPKNS
ncbi:TDP-N-acetylfucosamine:lipid II N-acetylfucosaminyltransferase [Odoribacter lunatus]|uniref:TDP-N-acetylfucosamine:lipid II N-acetylfucosaminyltransferase n=1 Tax=Odoribacter lunatus TaxID=2941335 RepID=UPI0020421C5B|nr:TDP-N-acetylfucosamine:lipid II N-acetylfucosaminyltransferase [Odoribacter lunatus]